MSNKSEFSKKLFKLVLPIAFEQFMLSLVSACDALMLGKLSQEAMSAVSLANQVSFVENLFFACVTIGLSVLAAQYYGKKDIETIEKLFAYVLKITASVSLVFFLVCFFVPEYVMSLLTNESVLIENGATYLKSASLSFLITGISQIYLCVFKNSEKADKASLISAVCVIVNIVLNSVFIFGLFSFPKMGIAGAALATVISRVIQLVWCVFETKKKNGIKLKISYFFKNDKILIKSFWKYTLPVLGNETVWGLGFTMFTVIMGHLGTDAVAANSVAAIVKNLACCFCLGLGSGSGIIVGNELGKGQIEKGKEYGDKLSKLSILFGVITALAVILLIPLTLSVTNLSDEASEYLTGMMFICAYNIIGKSVNSTTIAGIFCSGGDTKFGFLCDSVTLWLIIIPVGVFFAFVLKAPVIAVYFILSLDEIIKLPAVYRHYKKYLWLKDLTAQRKEEGIL